MENIKLDRNILLDSVNIAKDILKLENGQEKLDSIGAEVVAEYDEDKRSRAGWEAQMVEANKLALQVSEQKNFPWANAANVKFPLITIAALQFSSRMAPAFMNGKSLVKCGVTGKDNGGKKKARAERISTHMTFQLRREDEEWEDDHDRMLFALPIVGSTFKKSYYDPVKDQNISEYVLPDHLVISYKAKFNRAERKTHRLFYTPRQVKERQLRGSYLDVDLTDPAYTPDEGQNKDDEREGTAPAQEKLHELLEMHRFLDLDGDDYGEPYVVTVNRQDGKVVRIVARFAEDSITTDSEGEIKAIVRQLARNTRQLQQQGAKAAQKIKAEAQQAEEQAAQNIPPEQRKQAQQPVQKKIEGMVRQKLQKVSQQIKAQIEDGARQADEQVRQIKRTAKIIAIKPTEYFTKYGFIPNPYSGIYDLGFGSLLGPINETINTALNQLLDAATLANAGGGWFGRGAKRKGSIRTAPGVWQQTSIPGKDLQANIVPYPIKEPSMVMFNLINLLITYGERVASVTDMMTGETPGQNTPATTSMAALEQGMKVFQGIFKRIFRAATQEFRKLYLLNRDHVDMEKYIELLDADASLLEADYIGDAKDIEPVADESMITDQQRMAKAAFLQQRAKEVPHYDPVAVEQRIMEAVGIADISEVYPTDGEGKPTIPQPPNMELQLQLAEEERHGREAQDRKEKADAEIQIKAQNSQFRQEVEKGRLQIEGARLKVQIEESRVNMALTAARAKKEGIEADLEPVRVSIEAFVAEHDAVMAQIEAVKDAQASKKESSDGSSRGVAGSSSLASVFQGNRKA